MRRLAITWGALSVAANAAAQIPAQAPRTDLWAPNVPPGAVTILDRTMYIAGGFSQVGPATGSLAISLGRAPSGGSITLFPHAPGAHPIEVEFFAREGCREALVERLPAGTYSVRFVPADGGAPVVRDVEIPATSRVRLD